MALSFESSRLKVFEVPGDIGLSEREVLLNRIPEILTPSVVKHLPGYFHGIDSQEKAQAWLARMLSESRLFLVKYAEDKSVEGKFIEGKSVEDSLIGFLFAVVENGRDAHIGYLLSEEYWGKGLANELLQGFILKSSKTEQWVKLIGGVAPSNIASANLLKKLGFVEQTGGDNSVVFYEYKIPQPQS
ncbi:GNAT family N-acetyltransferase [Amphritea balenae]|uniref:N-acetyltransferase n=1 Tax=Amphritea balenae TaxID=452629 RepID=A0A3P1SJB4_9GAMM|nr:GNAT family N-acetyltransferase [Amphritea balenae]RRC97114.1 N-acetyltransferase [Amphritea balenae]GGK68094.1 ferrichrome ABC transporter substrate-binding protein [Amphritea balenae]